MPESDLHNFIKTKIAEALTELGFETKTEERFDLGRLDVSARKGGEHIKVEVIRTHKPDWILCEVKQTIKDCGKQQLVFQSPTINFGVTFPKKLFDSLEKIRGDIPRAVFLQRCFEESMESKK